MYCAILLQNKTKVAVPSDWVQYKSRRFCTKVFISADVEKVLNFDLPAKFFCQQYDAIYYGHFLAEFGEFFSLIHFFFHHEISLQILQTHFIIGT